MQTKIFCIYIYIYISHKLCNRLLWSKSNQTEKSDTSISFFIKMHSSGSQDIQLNYEATDLTIKWKQKTCLSLLLFSDKMRPSFWHLLLICRGIVYAKKNIHNITTMYKQKDFEKWLICLTDLVTDCVSNLSPVTTISEGQYKPSVSQIIQKLSTATSWFHNPQESMENQEEGPFLKQDERQLRILPRGIP